MFFTIKHNDFEGILNFQYLSLKYHLPMPQSPVWGGGREENKKLLDTNIFLVKTVCNAIVLEEDDLIFFLIFWLSLA